jgi:Major intrinsic protein
MQVALAFGLTIATMVFATAHTSGGQVNPTVTFSLMCVGAINPLQAVVNVIAQVRSGSHGLRLEEVQDRCTCSQVEIIAVIQDRCTCSQVVIGIFAWTPPSMIDAQSKGPQQMFVFTDTFIAGNVCDAQRGVLDPLERGISVQSGSGDADGLILTELNRTPSVLTGTHS